MTQSVPTTLHLVLSMGYTTDSSFSIIAGPIGVFRRKSDAIMTAQAESEMGEIVVEGQRFKQRTAIVEAIVQGNPTSVHVVWSSAFSKDGTGKFFSKVEGLFLNEADAKARVNQIAQGLQEISGVTCEVKTEARQLNVR